MGCDARIMFGRRGEDNDYVPAVRFICYDCGEVVTLLSEHRHGNEWNGRECVKVNIEWVGAEVEE